MTKIKILVVDDIQQNIDALAALIAADDVEIVSTTDPNEALAILTKGEFGLALVDVEMPLMSGFDLARTIRSVKRYRHLPLIFVTAHQANANFLFEGYETGAVDMLFKPIDPNIVRQKVRFFVEVQQQKSLLHQHMEELERLKIVAEAANFAKTQFLANMSHEIRTPLTAILGFTGILLKENLSNEERQKYVGSVERNGDLLLRLIDDILDLSKIEANRLDLENIEFDLGDILRDVSATLSLKAQQKNVVLNLQVPSTEQANYKGDPTRIKQVLLNIIGNAIKFTAAGTVDVQVKITDKTTTHELKALRRHLITVQVRDEGVGIEPSQVSHLFEIFSQADPSTKRNFGGTGLGLVISRKIARSMNGDVKLVSSALGQGSIFEIKLELEWVSSSASASVS